MTLDAPLKVSLANQEVTVKGEQVNTVSTDPAQTPARWYFVEKTLKLYLTIRTILPPICRRWPAPPPVPMADRSSSTDFPARSSRRSPLSARSASIRILSQPSMTAWFRPYRDIHQARY